MRFWPIVFVWCLTVAPAFSFPDSDYQTIVHEAIENHIRPQYNRLDSASVALAIATQNACEKKLPLHDPGVILAFRAAATAWGGAQHLHWGPAVDDERYQRISFGPDPKDYVGGQVERLIAEADPALLEPGAIRSKSIAVQGLTALELLIHAQRSIEVGGSYRCALAEVIAQNIADIARDIAADWTSPEGYASILTSPGPQNRLFQNQQEAAMEAFKPLVAGLRFMIDIKLKDPLQTSADQARPRYFEFWRNGATNGVLTANLDALQDLYMRGGFAAQIAPRNEELDRQIRDGFTQSLTILKNIEMPLAEAVKDPQARIQLVQLVAVLESLWTSIAFDVAETLELTIGFNEFDGD